MNLMLGRGLGRRREIAVRAALGSGRARLVRQLVAEGLVLAIAGGASGVLAAVWAVQWFNAVNPIELPVGADVRVNGTVLAASVVLSVATALLFSVLPAWRASDVDLNDALKSVSRTATGGASRSVPRLLIAAEVALSVVLLTGAGLLMESVIRFGSAPVGFQADGVVSARVMLPRDRYADAARRNLLFDELQKRIAGIRGVRSVAVASALPPQGGGNASIDVEGRPVAKGMERHDVGRAAVSANYFSVLGVPLLRGRVFGAGDGASSEPVAIVNQALAREYFPTGEAVGQRIRSDYSHEISPWLRIVGVVGTEKKTTVYQEMALVDVPMVFRPDAQDPPKNAQLAIRVESMRDGFGEDVQRAIAAVDSDIPVSEIRTMRGELGAILAYPRFRAIVLSGFAGFALLLAAVGVLGVLQQFVTQRKREIGVRMAVGAQRLHIARLVASQAGLPVAGGLVAGVTGAVVLSRYVANLFYDVKAGDPVVLAGVTGVLLVTAVVAMVVPARRAMSVDPMTVLHDE
jgi:predicted permease